MVIASWRRGQKEDISGDCKTRTPRYSSQKLNSFSSFCPVRLKIDSHFSRECELSGLKLDTEDDAGKGRAPSESSRAVGDDLLRGFSTPLMDGENSRLATRRTQGILGHSHSNDEKLRGPKLFFKTQEGKRALYVSNTECSTH